MKQKDTGPLKKKIPIIHPFLLVLLPILNLYSTNMNELSLRVIFRPVIITLGSTVILYIILSRIIRDRSKAGIFLTTLIIMVSGWFHFLVFIRKFIFINYIHHTIIWILLFSVLSILVLMAKSDNKKITGILNITSAILIFLVILPIAFYELRTTKIPAYQGDLQPLIKFKNPVPKQDLPDIYYIVLDGYGGNSNLKKYYNFDNSDFTNYLSEKGFFIADKARTNYTETLFSLTSSMNMHYLTSISNRMSRRSNNRRPVAGMLKNNNIFNFLKKHGYHISTMVTGFHITEIKNVSSYHTKWNFISQFEGKLLASTLFQLILNKTFYLNHGKRIQFAMDKIDDHQSPQFSFVHILCPHPPFIFQPEGNIVYPKRPFEYADGDHLVKSQKSYDYYVVGYPRQVSFLNTQIKKIIDRLTRDTSHPKIIIIQGDHGPGSQFRQSELKRETIDERLFILNAYYFSDRKYDDLYPSISPVNSFRVIFNKIFQLKLKLLNDRHFFVPCFTPYQLVELP